MSNAELHEIEEEDQIEEETSLMSLDRMLDEQEAHADDGQDDHMFWFNRGLEEDYKPSYL